MYYSAFSVQPWQSSWPLASFMPPSITTAEESTVATTYTNQVRLVRESDYIYSTWANERDKRPPKSGPSVFCMRSEASCFDMQIL